MTPSALWTGFLTLVMLSPLPLGSNRPLAWSVICLVLGALMLGWSWLGHKGQLRIFWRPAFWPPAVIFVIILAWIVIQTGFLPAPATHPLWDISSAALGKELNPAIGLAPDAAVVGVAKLLSYVSSFWLALQVGRDPDRSWQLVRWFSWASAAYAAYGLVNYLAGNEYLLWFPRWAYIGDVTSTFVNRNTYATYASLGILATVALFHESYYREWRMSDRTLPAAHRFIESLIGAPLIYLVMIVVIAMAWLQSHSRMGFVAGGLGIITYLILLQTSGAMKSRVVASLAASVAAIFVIYVSGQGTISRIEATQDMDRAPLFSLTVDAIRAAPWTGYGYGSFPYTFPMFRDQTLSGHAHYTQAHNTYLELMFEIGVPATLALLFIVIWISSQCLRGVYVRRRSKHIPALAAAATITVSVHALTDFSLQIPAIACMYASILGAGYAQSWPLKGRQAF